MGNPAQRLTIGALAREAGIGIETIRFYQRKGLLAEPDRPHGGIRRYGEADAARLRFIKAAQRLGFSLDEVADLLQLEDGTHCLEARALAERKLTDVRGRIAGLKRMETALADLIDHCAANGGVVACPLIAALHEG